MSHRLPHARRTAGLSGLATALLFLGANAIWALDQPGRDATAPALLGFYDRLAGRIIVGALLSLVAMATLLVFAASLRALLAELEDDTVLADVAFGGALVAAAAGVGAETINMAAALQAQHATLTAPVAQALFDISYVLGYYAGGIGLGCWRSPSPPWRCGMRRSPRSLALVGIPLGVALLTPLSRYALAPSSSGCSGWPWCCCGAYRSRSSRTTRSCGDRTH